MLLRFFIFLILNRMNDSALCLEDNYLVSSIKKGIA